MSSLSHSSELLNLRMALDLQICNWYRNKGSFINQAPSVIATTIGNPITWNCIPGSGMSQASSKDYQGSGEIKIGGRTMGTGELKNSLLVRTDGTF